MVKLAVGIIFPLRVLLYLFLILLCAYRRYRAPGDPDVLGSEAVTAIATATGKSPAQVRLQLSMSVCHAAFTSSSELLVFNMSGFEQQTACHLHG